MTLKRGEIYRILFPYTLDKNYPNGKLKYVLVLQEGKYFKRFNTIEILLITSDKEHISREENVTDIEIPRGMTDLELKSWVVCGQQYPVRKTLFEHKKVKFAGVLSSEIMEEIDEALYIALCMKLKQELEKEEPVGNFFFGALVGGFVGAVGTAAYMKYRNTLNQDENTISDMLNDAEETTCLEETSK